MPRDRIAPPPITQPVITTNGRANLAWTKWFNDVQQKINAVNGLVYLAAKLSFTGRNSNGAVTILNADSHNIESMDRVSVGVYEGEITQQTALGVNLFDTAWPSIAHDINPSVSTETFEVIFTPIDDTNFRLSVYELVQGAGGAIDMVLYDPVETGDIITLAIHSNINSDLPPA